MFLLLVLEVDIRFSSMVNGMGVVFVSGGWLV